MMGPGFGQGIADGLVMIAVVLVAGTAAITAAFIFGIPWLWGLLKPWLHAITS